MKKCIYSICLLVWSTFVFGQTQSYKRGFCVSGNFNNNDIIAAHKGVSWFYNWGVSTPATPETYNMDFAPMMWNNEYDRDKLKAYLRANPQVTYLLTFNEPNFVHQANITPQQAADAWSEIESIADEFNLKIISPAVNYSPDAPYNDPVVWLDEFFDICTDCRVDYIAVHFYMPNIGGLRGSVERFYKYNKPIWLTEFCMDKTGLGSVGTADEQRKFVVETVNWLETEDNIYRYAWFMERNWGTYPVISMFEKNNSNLTELGKVYVNMSSYDKEFYHETEQVIEAEHYINMNNVSLAATTDTHGTLNITAINTNSYIDYQIDIPASGEYNLFLRVASLREAAVSLTKNGINLKTVDIPTTGSLDSWETISVKVNLTAGKQTLRLKSEGSGFLLNWLAFSTSDVPPVHINTASASKITLYPSPVEKELFINTEEKIKEIAVFDSNGSLKKRKENNSSIDVSDMNAGIYYIQCLTESGNVYTAPVIKE